jgi:hypothetical protein
MQCPHCLHDMTPIATDIAPPLALTACCERTVKLEDHTAVLATAADTVHLPSEQLLALRQARTKTRVARRAYFLTHRGRA